MQFCWDFHSLRVPSAKFCHVGKGLTAWFISPLLLWYKAGAASLPQLQVIGNVNTKLDSSISIPSFDINVKMVEVPTVR